MNFMWVKTMVKDNCVFILIMSFFLCKHILLKLFIALICVVYLLKYRANIKEICWKLWIYLGLTIMLNWFVNINLDLLNFVYFCLLSVILKNINRDIYIYQYFNVYLIIIGILGGVNVCLNL